MEALKAKVVLVGDPGVGKTSLVLRYTRREFDERYRMTLGAVVHKRDEAVVVNGRTVRVTLTLWDTMGEPALADALRDVYLYGAQAVLAVCDVTRAPTVRALDPWLNAAARIAGDVPVHLLLNKADLGPGDGAVPEGLRTGSARAAPCYLTSARTGDNVDRAFADLARRIVERHLVAPDGALDDADRRIALRCHAARSADEIASLEGVAAIVAEARLERLRRRGYVTLSVALDGAGRPRTRYAATASAFTGIGAAADAG